ncbi:uncharacterized protein LOC118407517 [Branchiostoma floridae]|uniref:Uncharacterized protein LOC118407517 n=1 Tax=Branchiostoma floridae TaxID=7739 RepID=A0A9J7HSY8_BRAFL|nr:uncharacterized protein LOC118407517 [Branchiostoma floridae]
MVHHVTPLGHNSREPIPTSLPRNLVMGHSSMYQVSADTRMYLRCSAAFSEPDDSHTAGMQTGSVTSISRRFLLCWQTAIKTYAGPFMSHAAGDCRPRPHRTILTGAAIVYGSRAPSAERTQAPNAAMVGSALVYARPKFFGQYCSWIQSNWGFTGAQPQAEVGGVSFHFRYGCEELGRVCLPARGMLGMTTASMEERQSQLSCT